MQNHDYCCISSMGTVKPVGNWMEWSIRNSWAKFSVFILIVRLSVINFVCHAPEVSIFALPNYSYLHLVLKSLPLRTTSRCTQRIVQTKSKCVGSTTPNSKNQTKKTHKKKQKKKKKNRSEKQNTNEQLGLMRHVTVKEVRGWRSSCDEWISAFGAFPVDCGVFS